MAVAADALDRAEPPLLRRAAEQLDAAVPALRVAAGDLHDLVRRTAAGWTGAGHDAWERKVDDLADRVQGAAEALAALGSAVAEVGSAASSGQEQLRAVAATAAALFGDSLSLAEVESAAVRAHYDGVLLGARRCFDAVADQAPPAPEVPLVCPPPPPAPDRPWWDDLLFGNLPVVLDQRCRPIPYVEGGRVPRSMLAWVRKVGRADALDEPADVLRQLVVTAPSYDKEAAKHAPTWFGGQFNKAMKERWTELVARGLRSSQLYNGLERTKEGLVRTLNHVHYEEGKHLLVEVYVDGPRRGKVMAVKVLSQHQLSAARRAIEAVK